jgi:metallo-beta-lactamase family protein
MINKQLQVTCWGGVGTVTGANFLLEDEKTRILVDCGLVQGTVDADDLNRAPFPYNPKTIDYLLVTHAHMDHIGRVPKLVRDGFTGVIYSTPETKELAKLMLEDALRVMETQSNEKGIDPLYSPVHLTMTFSLWQTIPYHTPTQINDSFTVNALDAGHILGSAMYEITHTDKAGKKTKIVFTGDSGNSPAPLLKDTEQVLDADYMVMDSVYGDRNHEPKQERDMKFRRIVQETINKKGALVIPAFSLERTQVILYELNNMIEEKQISSVPVFLDSPLGAKVTEVYARLKKDFNVGVQNEIRDGDDIFNFPKLSITQTSMDSREIINTHNPKIIIAGSGMSSGGRVIQHEMNFLPDSKSTILLMGYQAVGTLGRKIQEKPKTIDINGEQIPVKARIEMISGYSSHKDSNHLVAMVADSMNTLKRVFVTMGEPKSSTFLAQRLRDELGVDAIYPERGKAYKLQ